MITDIRPLLRRILLAGLPLLPAACCPEDPVREQVFLLNPGTDGGLLGVDAGQGLDAGPAIDTSGVCDDLAADCGGGADCVPVCKCVLDRNRVGYVSIQRCKLNPQPGAPAVYVRYTEPSVCVGGRRPAGYAERTGRPATPAAAYLTQISELEAASIAAFDILAAELEAHGAPRSMVRRARSFRRDEARHWALMRAAARAHGGAPRAPRVARRRRARSLEAVLRENAVEGCVRETFGALLARVQAVSAADPGLRAAFALIADDEANHAQLAWDVHAWGRQHLSTAARRRIARARASAAAELAADVAKPGLDAQALRLLGLPGPAAQAALVAQARRLMWG
jgi:hypothetical protein